jgi:alginate O-acetyltransferase complex protein AlgI
MLFSSLTFLCFFFPVFFLLYFAAKKRRTRNFILLVFSLVFYAWGEPLYIFLMLFSLTLNWAFALLIDRYRDKARLFLVIDTAVNLALIGVYKYAGFFVSAVNMLPGVELTVPQLTLPIGISFYTFQILSYVIDVYRRDTEVQPNILTLGAYLSAFPQLIAGPIVRYRTVEDELENRVETLDDVAEGLRRFIAGLAKKTLIANVMAQVVDSLLSRGPSEYGTLGAWIAILSYTLQIYYDFSGYSDMAIGMGRMMGFHYLENFDYPYIAASVTDFWRRWHISLSTFFRDYVYIPLGGNRCSRRRWAFNMAVVWSLTGLWHGADWNFVLWGVYYGAILIGEKLLWGRYIEKVPVVRNVYALACAVFGWVLFRAETLGQARQILGAMFGAYGNGGASLPILLQTCRVDLVFVITFAVGCVLAAPVWPAIKSKMRAAAQETTKTPDAASTVPAVVKRKSIAVSISLVASDVCAVVALAASVLSLAVGAYNPVIYFRF